MGPKKFWVQKLFVKILGPKKFGLRNNFGSKKKFGSRKILGPKIYLSGKILCPEKKLVLGP